MAGRALFCLLVALVCGGCQRSGRPDPLPYRFRTSMVQMDDDPLLDRSSRSKPRARRSPARSDGGSVAARCRKRVGWRYRGSLAHAQRTLIRACFRRQVPPAALRGSGLSLRSDQPRPGDLALFHRTTDRDGDGRVDDRFSLAGVVVAVADPRVSFVYIRGGRARLGVLNLEQPNRRRLDGSRVQNSFLRVIRPGDPPSTHYLAGQLLAGFAKP